MHIHHARTCSKLYPSNLDPAFWGLGQFDRYASLKRSIEGLMLSYELIATVFDHAINKISKDSTNVMITGSKMFASWRVILSQKLTGC